MSMFKIRNQVISRCREMLVDVKDDGQDASFEVFGEFEVGISFFEIGSGAEAVPVVCFRIIIVPLVPLIPAVYEFLAEANGQNAFCKVLIRKVQGGDDSKGFLTTEYCGVAATLQTEEIQFAIGNMVEVANALKPVFTKLMLAGAMADYLDSVDGDPF